MYRERERSMCILFAIIGPDLAISDIVMCYCVYMYICIHVYMYICIHVYMYI